MKSLKIEINAPEVGETAWILWLGKALECEVKALEFEGRVRESTKVSTTVFVMPKAKYDMEIATTPETLFRTRQELLASL